VKEHSKKVIGMFAMIKQQTKRIVFNALLLYYIQYDGLYTNGSKIGHGSFFQIIPVLGGLQIRLTYQNLANNFAERSVEEKINFSPVKYPKEVRER